MEPPSPRSPEGSPAGALEDQAATAPLRVAGLFAGIGGIEEGLHQAGHSTALLCEIDPHARAVLRERFPGVSLVDDICRITELPNVDLVSAGFPCQDLSQAGRTAGIRGARSGLVGEVFRLLDEAPHPPRWLLLENVRFMLQLERGRAMRYLTDELVRRGYLWAYRVVDSQAFGLPQRRQRVILLASRIADPRPVLLNEDTVQPDPAVHSSTAFGFYWTEGTRGLGWAVDSIPTLKGGSGVGIPSPPAIWLPQERRMVLPDIRDAERLQGFEADWTTPVQTLKGHRGGRGARWRLVGNAVSVPVARWVGGRLRSSSEWCDPGSVPLGPLERWPTAAWGSEDGSFAVERSLWPIERPRLPLREFLQFETTPLSERATRGFLGRARASYLNFADGFLDDVEHHLARMEAVGAVAAVP